MVVTPWCRSRTETHDNGWNVQRTEYLDLDAVAKRLWEAMRDRPEAGVRGWIDVAINGWPDEH